MQQFINLIISFFGSVLGQLLFIVGASIVIQKSKKYEDTFKDAFLVYVKKDTGPLVMGILVILIYLFILPEIIANFQAMDLEGVAQDNKYRRIITGIVKWNRSYSVLLGILAQGIGMLGVSKAGKWLKKVGGDIDNDFIKKNNQ